MATEAEKQSKYLDNLNKGIKELVDQIKLGFTKTADKVGETFNQVIQDEMKEVYDLAKDGFSYIKDTGKKSIEFTTRLFGIDLKSWIEARKQRRATEKLAGIAARDEKRKLMKFKGGGIKGFLAALFDILGFPLLLIGTAAGAAFAYIKKPFDVIMKVGKAILGPIWNWGIKLLRRIPFITKGLESIGKLFQFFERIPGMRWLMKGFRFGTRLFWPIQFIISFFDFMEGFEKEGPILEKIKKGLRSVLEGFFELPAKLFGKIVDWVGKNILGFEMEGDEGEKILKGLGDSFEWIYDNVIGGWILIGQEADKLIERIKDMKIGPTIEKAARDLIERVKRIPEDVARYLIETLPGGNWVANKFFSEKTIEDIKEKMEIDAENRKKQMEAELERKRKLIESIPTIGMTPDYDITAPKGIGTQMLDTFKQMVTYAKETSEKMDKLNETIKEREMTPVAIPQPPGGERAIPETTPQMWWQGNPMFGN